MTSDLTDYLEPADAVLSDEALEALAMLLVDGATEEVET
jgi:hypothetical protein